MINDSVEDYDKLVTSEQKNKYISSLLGRQQINENDLQVVLSFLEYGTRDSSHQPSAVQRRSWKNPQNPFLGSKRYSVETNKRPFLNC